jgi:hypothetical protein
MLDVHDRDPCPSHDASRSQCCISMSPYCMSMLYAQAACACSMSTCVSRCMYPCMSMLHIHAACPSCKTMLHVSDSTLHVRFSMLHVHVSMLHISAPCTCCMSMLLVHPAYCMYFCFMSILPLTCRSCPRTGAV